MGQDFIDMLARNARMQRDAMLSETDFLVLRAYESGAVVPQAWVEYRQALRDVTQHPKFPSCFPWPEKPE